ncbi:MAG TPA: FAD-binding oxidoreductase [Pseudonocardia sp.]|nr:FAD-binding oxidoreductase [Pseudonocardia sp.]
MSATTVSGVVGVLQTTVAGRVIAPGDVGYDRARTVAYGIDRRPAAVVRARNATDVARVVRLARERGLELAVRSGGHSPAGHGTTDGGIVLDLAGLKSLDIDARRRTAWAGAGLTAGEYTAATAAHGLATGFGDTGSVGLGGITLSGGIGYLVRAHGLTIDNLLAADVVTADGELRHVDASRHPELFWAIRGGGGNVGVATHLRYRLSEVDLVTGGTLVLPATPQTLVRYVAEALAASEQLTTVATVMPVGPHGPLVMRAVLVHSGEPAEGDRDAAPFRALAAPIADTVGLTRYRDLLVPAGGGDHQTWAHRTMFLDAVDVDAAEAILAALHDSDSPMPLVQLRVLGGAMARVPADATAFAHRTAPILANVAALYEHLDELPSRTAWVDGLTSVLRPRNGAAVGFLGAEGRSGVRRAYPGGTGERLAEIKGCYDPTNLFRHNQNVPPASRP